MDDEEKRDLIKRIIVGALGNLALWRKPVSRLSVGPAFPEVYDRFEQELSQMRTAMERRLALWSVRELSDVVPESEAPKLNPLYDPDGRLGRLALDLRRLKSRTPQDFVGGWSVAGKEIDLPYWSAFTSVSLEDAVFLSVGREPSKASYDAVCKAYGHSDEENALLYFLEDRRELIANAMGCDPEDARAKVLLMAFFDWVEDTRLPIDPAFHTALRSRFRPEPLGTDAGSNLPAIVDHPTYTSIDARERSSLHKIIITMAIDFYGYDPIALRSPIPKQIGDMAAELGLEVTVETIRKHLKQGGKLLPEGWNKKKD